MVYMLKTFAMVPRPWGKLRYLTLLTENFALRGGGFANIWLQTMSNLPPWPERGKVGVSIDWRIYIGD